MFGSKGLLEKYRPILYCEILREKWIGDDPMKSKVAQFLLSL